MTDAKGQESRKGKKQVAGYIPAKLHKEFRSIVAMSETTCNELVEGWVQNYVDSQRSEKTE